MDLLLENRKNSFRRGSAKGSLAVTRRLPLHRNISLALSSVSMGDKVTSLLVSIPSYCTDKTTYGQPSDEKVECPPGTHDPGC
jgi:hypothetical protein